MFQWLKKLFGGKKEADAAASMDASAAPDASEQEKGQSMSGEGPADEAGSEDLK
jgi:hypothetical protein